MPCCHGACDGPPYGTEAIPMTTRNDKLTYHFVVAGRTRICRAAEMPDMERWPVGRLLSTAARLVEHAWNKRMHEMGLTHAGVIALDVLSVKGPITQTALGQIVRVQAQTMGQTLVRLEAHGHIKRERGVPDRRKNVVSITEAGRAALIEAHELERELLGTLAIDTEGLRRELKIVVRELAARDSTPISEAIVAAADTAR